MRKTKENLRLAKTNQDVPDVEALETEREQRYEEIDGETSTEGVGRGFTTDSAFEESVDSADGPLSGDSMTPPVHRTNLSKKNKRRRKVNPNHGNHPAARSSKAI